MFNNKNSDVVFRDRPLKKGEKYHHYCKNCGRELHPDMAYRHKCSPLIIKEITHSKEKSPL